MTNSILDLNAEATIVSSIFLMNKAISGFAEWEWQKNVVNEQETVGTFVKRVSTWHSITVSKTLQEVSSIHTPPAFVTECLDQNSIRDSEHLHAELLKAASMQIIVCMDHGEIGQRTLQKITKWFDMMKIAMAAFKGKGIGWVIRKFEETKNTMPTMGPDHLFFNPQVLFIYIAHLVNYYTSTDEKYPTKVTVTEKAFMSWELKSGKMFRKLFNVGELTLTKLQILSSPHDDETLLDNTIGFGIPLHPIAMDTQKNGLTSMGVIQETVWHQILTDLQDLDERSFPNIQDTGQFEKLFILVEKMRKFQEESKALVKSREKQMRSYHKKRKRVDAYTPTHPTNFERDIFMMGVDSYYYHFCCGNGIANRKFPPN